MNNRRHVHAVEWHSDKLVLLDQRKLPVEEVYVICQTLAEAIEAIRNMTVRGAPAIGITAAYACVLAARERLQQTQSNDLVILKPLLIQDFNVLKTARPTAVNLAWAVDKALALLDRAAGAALDLPFELLALAKSIHEEDLENNHLMAELACDFMQGKHNEGGGIAASGQSVFSIITHCNAGSLATGGYGTALGVARLAWEQKIIDKVYADETRPWFQGARITAWELNYEGIPVCLNIDSAAAWLMSNKNIKWVIVGADRIAANGDVANKIGTFQLAIAARYHHVKVMVVAPSSTVDLSIESGDLIQIEMRDATELTEFKGQELAPEGVEVINPVFDITPASLIDVIVTEKGIIERPSREKMLWTLA
jgi:methylthioribose-1-phosphate isomerase